MAPSGLILKDQGGGVDLSPFEFVTIKILAVHLL